MRKFFYIIAAFLISQAVIAEVLPAELRNKLAEVYQGYTKIQLKIVDPLLESEKWRFVKDNTVYLSSNESFNLMAKIYQILKKPALTQKNYDQLLQSSILQKGVMTNIAQTNPIVKSLVAFFNQAGASRFSSEQNANKNWQFAVSFLPAPAPSIKTPEKTLQTAITPIKPSTVPMPKAPGAPSPKPEQPLSNKSPNFLQAVAQLAKQNVQSWLSQSWRFDEPGALKISSNDSFGIVTQANNNKPLPQASFNSFMKALSSGQTLTAQQTSLKNRVDNLLKALPIKRFTTHLVNNNWQFKLHLANVANTPSAASQPAPQASSATPQKPASTWLFDIIKNTAHYYLKAYEDDPNDYAQRNIQGKTIRVNRPDHALAHAIRKTAMLMDLLNMIRSSNQPQQAFNAIQQLSVDLQNFDSMAQLAIFLLRAGRQSEDLENQYYKKYTEQSGLIFRNEAKKFPNLFRDADINDFEIAMKAMGDKDLKLSPRQQWIENILYAVHHLDLLRIPTFGGGKALDVDMLKDSVAGFLGTQKGPFVDKLFDLSSKYLDATGDVNVPAKRLSRTDDFFIQSQRPDLIIEALKKVGGFKDL